MKYVEWCIDHKVPKILAGIPIFIGTISPLVFVAHLGWPGIPLAAIGMAGNFIILDIAQALLKEIAQALLKEEGK